MRFMKWFSLFFVSFFTIVTLSACASSLVKPTGLEDKQNQQTVGNEIIEIEQSKTNIEVDNDKFNIAEQEYGSQAIDVDDSDTAVSDSENSSKKEIEVAKNDKYEKTTVGNPTKKSPSTSNHKTETSAKKESTTKSVNSAPIAKDAPKKSAENKPKEQADDKEKNPNKGKTEETPNEKNPEQPKQKKSTITHSIVISASEVPLLPTIMEINDGDTVLQALIQITMAKKIQMDYRGGQGATAYVQGLANVYEFDRGQGSGWMYRVNGIFPDRGAGVVPLCDGDVVEWLYTTNLGQDLGADLKPLRRDGTCPK